MERSTEHTGRRWLLRGLIALLVLGMTSAAVELHQAPHWSLDPNAEPVLRIFDAHHPGRPTHFHAVLGSEELHCLGCLSNLRNSNRLLCAVSGTVQLGGLVLRPAHDSRNVVRNRTRTVEARGPPRA